MNSVVIQQIAFFLVLAAAGYFIWKRVSFIRGNIALGKKVMANDRKEERLKNTLLVAFGQQKMFKKFIPAFLHLFIYVGFLVINLEVLEFIIDGLAGTHRIFAPYLGSFYTILMNMFESLAVAVLVACVVFLIRRNILKINRFQSAEMTKWPRMDANLILFTEIILMFAILTMNAADQVLQTRDAHYTATGSLFFSSFLLPLFENINTLALVIIERFAWWFHIIGILAFSIYVTYSKHLHIFLAFPNTYFAKLEPKGRMTNMPVVTHEVKSMLGIADAVATEASTAAEPGRFGAKDVNDLA
jgi:hypothetical protein